MHALLDAVPGSLASQPPVIAVLEQALARAEAAEQGLAIDEGGANIDDRVATGSFYTPSDVVDRFWRQYWAFHGIDSASDRRRHLVQFTFVEPSVGAGVFLFSLLREGAKAGCSPEELSRIRFRACDINSCALSFIEGELADLESALCVKFDSVRLVHDDFLKAPLALDGDVSFIGNPPYVRTPPGARWKNLYADFLLRMLEMSGRNRSIALIVPISIAFSRDYRDMRTVMRGEAGIRLDNFDNMPDFLFKVGKPGSKNTNRANSQRCTILMVRNFGSPSWEATELQRWSASGRAEFLASDPEYRSFRCYSVDDQFPRPSTDWIVRYLEPTEDDLKLADLIGSRGSLGFSVGAVARNFIGIRELAAGSSAYDLRFESEQQMLCALQILGSDVFYEYWRTAGDGFHVTKSDIMRFPVRRSLLDGCLFGLTAAKDAWENRGRLAKRKLNSGVEVCSYDFTGQFGHLRDYLFASPAADPRAAEVLKTRAPVQAFFPGLLATGTPR